MNTLIAVIGLGILTLLLEILNLRKAIIPFTMLGLLGILGLTVLDYDSPAAYYNNMVVVSNYSVCFSSLFIVLTIFFAVILVAQYISWCRMMR